MYFKPIDRDVIYYFQPEADIYSHYSSTYNLMDLTEAKTQFVKAILEESRMDANKARELYKAALSSQPKIIKASSPHPFQETLSDQDLINLHLIFADTIGSEIEDTSKKSLFKRVASEEKLPIFAKAWTKIKKFN